MISESGCIRIMFFNVAFRLMIQRAIQYIGGIARWRIDDLGIKRRIVLGNVSIKIEPYLVLKFPLDSPQPPVLNRCPSEEDVVLSPTIDKNNVDTVHLSSKKILCCKYHLEHAKPVTKIV